MTQFSEKRTAPAAVTKDSSLAGRCDSAATRRPPHPAQPLGHATSQGRPAFWAAWRERFFQDEVRPRIAADARALVQSHRVCGDLRVPTTATMRAITELTTADLGFEHPIATEAPLERSIYNDNDNGRTEGVPEMRDGKVERRHSGLAGRGLAAGVRAAVLAQAHAYSDSANAPALLGAVGHPVAVDPDPRLRTFVGEQIWPVLQLRR